MRCFRPFLIPPALSLGLLCHAASLPRPLPAPQSPCEPDLNRTGDDPYGYRLRGDRCEGIYIRDVASTTLVVASLTESFENFNPASGRNLVMEWSAPGNADVHLRAGALRRKFYYRMDTIRPAGSTSYTWPPSLLATFDLGRNELGIVAWTSYPVGNTNRNVYVPLRIGQQAAAAQSSSYQLTLMAGAELSEVYLSMAPVSSGGRPGPFIQRDQALGYGYYPAERSININIPKPKARGLYYLEIGATLRAGGSASTKVWFYHLR